MPIASLVLWILTALGGFYLLSTWLARGGMRGGGTRFPAGVVFGHFLLAAVGLVLWIVYVITDSRAIAWTAFLAIVLVALLGFTMFARWLQGRRQPSSAAAGGGAAVSDVPAEQHFPTVAVYGHGLLGAATLLLVLLTAAELLG